MCPHKDILRCACLADVDRVHTTDRAIPRTKPSDVPDDVELSRLHFHFSGAPVLDRLLASIDLSSIFFASLPLCFAVMLDRGWRTAAGGGVLGLGLDRFCQRQMLTLPDPSLGGVKTS